MNSKNLSQIPEADFLLYQTENGQTRIEVRYSGETLWLSLNQIAELFDRDKSVISKHISNIFEENELRREQLLQKMQQLPAMGKRIKLITII